MGQAAGPREAGGHGQAARCPPSSTVLTVQDLVPGAQKARVCADTTRPPPGFRSCSGIPCYPSSQEHRTPSVSHSLGITEVCDQQVWDGTGCVLCPGTLSHHVDGGHPIVLSASTRPLGRLVLLPSPPGSPAPNTGQAGSGPRLGRLGPSPASPREWAAGSSSPCPGVRSNSCASTLLPSKCRAELSSASQSPWFPGRGHSAAPALRHPLFPRRLNGPCGLFSDSMSVSYYILLPNYFIENQRQLVLQIYFSYDQS